MILIFLTLSGQKKLRIRSSKPNGQMIDASLSIWVVDGDETITHTLVVTMDTRLHMNGDPMEWSSMGNNEVVVD